jgi:hypothetical protein
MIRSGQSAARTLLHARILLKADTDSAAPAGSDEALGEALEVPSATVARACASALSKKGWKRPCGPKPADVSTRANWTRRRRAPDRLGVRPRPGGKSALEVALVG